MSINTTGLGPRVSVTTTNSLAQTDLEFAQTDLTGSQTLLRNSADTISGSALTANEAVLLDTSDATAKLAIRVGDVVWQFDSTTSVDVS